jgi:hypothetical protein
VWGDLGQAEIRQWPIESRVVISRNGIYAQGQIADKKECLALLGEKGYSYFAPSRTGGIKIASKTRLLVRKGYLESSETWLNKLITEGRAAVLPLWSSWDWHVHPCSSAHQKEVTAALSWWLGVERAWIRHWQLLSFHTWDARFKLSSLSFFGRRFVPWWTWFHCTILKEFFLYLHAGRGFFLWTSLVTLLKIRGRQQTLDFGDRPGPLGQ